MAQGIIESIFSLSEIVLSDMLARFILAAVILLIGFVLGRMSGKLVQKVLHEFELNNLMKNATKVRIQAEEFLGTVTSYLIYFLVIVMALNQLGLTSIILYIISTAVIVIVIISFVLGVRDFIPNMFAGLTIQKKGFLKAGDRIEFRGMKGKVDYLNLIETRMITSKGDIISIPNSLLTKHEIIKKSNSRSSKKTVKNKD